MYNPRHNMAEGRIPSSRLVCNPMETTLVILPEKNMVPYEIRNYEIRNHEYPYRYPYVIRRIMAFTIMTLLLLGMMVGK